MFWISRITLNILTGIGKIISNYKDDVFSTRTGKCWDVKVKLHIDKNAIPVEQPQRRIPFALREKVRNEI